jgi:uncharacterized protein YfiM (DUF2279 family)
MEFGLAFVLWSGSFGAPQERDAPADRWLARDKALHFAVSAMVQGTAHTVLRANGFAYREASWTAGVTTLAVGVGKELWDRRAGRVLSWRDLVADAAGGGTGAVVMAQVGR